MSSSSSSNNAPDSTTNHADLHAFLRRRLPYTYVPTPLPSDVHSQLNDYYFPDTPTQDFLAVIDACLHGCYDVKRARYIFSRLREGPKNDSILSPRLYNLFLETYLEMSKREEYQKETWLREAWQLFNDMDQSSEPVKPNASTYAIMLKALRA